MPLNFINTVELIGPPGVGKSTLYKETCKHWKQSFKWVYEDRLLSEDKPPIYNSFSWLEYTYREISGKPLSKSLPVGFGLKFIDEHKELADFLWKYMNKNEKPVSGSCAGTDRKFRLAYFLFYTFCRYEAIGIKINKKPCLIEEGFLQKSIFMQQPIEGQEDFISQYLSLMPLPSAVVYINIKNPLFIVERLKNRKKVIVSHTGKDSNELFLEIRKWQQYFKLAMNILVSKGVRVFQVNGEYPVEENRKSITKFLDSI
jgi:hypothetical protein